MAQRLLRDVVALYDHKNLDALPEFVRADGTRINTTVEVMARAVFKALFERLADHHRSATDDKGLGTVTGLRVKLEESDVASASYWESNPGGLFRSSTRA